MKSWGNTGYSGNSVIGLNEKCKGRLVKRLLESSARGAQTPALIEHTIGQFFDAVARRLPKYEALVSRHQNKRFIYGELDRESCRLGSALTRSGLAKGGTRRHLAHNCYEWPPMQLATAKAGMFWSTSTRPTA